jgi:hypothetical protein
MASLNLRLAATVVGFLMGSGVAHADDPPSTGGSAAASKASASEPASDHTASRSEFGSGPAFTSGGLLDSGKLLLTGGVSTIEGAGGGGLASWATITGYATNDGIGANVHGTYVNTQRFGLTDYGVAAGLFNRVELSYAREEFNTRSVLTGLGFPNGFTLDQDIYGAKVRVLGDIVYDQDTLLPQIAVGVQYKVDGTAPLQKALLQAIGARSTSGTDFYVSATKLFLAQNLLVDTTLRFTKGNQTGLLGFGGDLHDQYRPQFEGSVAYLVTKHFAVGAEARTKSSNLSFGGGLLREDNWYDIFAAYAVNKHLSVTLAYASLGQIVVKNQNGIYLSLQAGF